VAAPSAVLRRASWRRRLYPYTWFLPLFLVLGAVLVYPWTWSFYLSFHSWNLAYGDAPSFVGLVNYVDVLSDGVFHLSLRNTLALIVVSVGLQVVLGLGYALLLDAGLPGRQVFLVAVMLPFILAPVMVGLIWKILLQEQFGIVNHYLRLVGLPAVSWLSDPRLTMPTVILLEVWQYTPFVILILYAGLQTVPAELREAARVDGASAWQMLRYVTLPWLRDLLLLVILFRVIFALRTFDVVYTLFKSGGPANAGMVLGVYLFEELKVNWELGRASAVSYLILAVTLVLGLGLARRTFRTPAQ
jgi:multiple sugar transport system permease protein